MQTNGVETGSVIPVNQPQGDAVPNAGGNLSNTPTISALGWNFGSQVGISKHQSSVKTNQVHANKTQKMI